MHHCHFWPVHAIVDEVRPSSSYGLFRSSTCRSDLSFSCLGLPASEWDAACYIAELNKRTASGTATSQSICYGLCKAGASKLATVRGCHELQVNSASGQSCDRDRKQMSRKRCPRQRVQHEISVVACRDSRELGTEPATRVYLASYDLCKHPLTSCEILVIDD